MFNLSEMYTITLVQVEIFILFIIYIIYIIYNLYYLYLDFIINFNSYIYY
jgi:hypothetical protein